MAPYTFDLIEWLIDVVVRRPISIQIVIVLYLNFQGQRCESSTLKVHTWLSRKRWPIEHTLLLPTQKVTFLWPLDWHIYIWPWPILKVNFKVMQISIVNISQTVTDRQTLLLATNRKLHAGFRLAYLHLTLEHCIGQGQGNPHLDCESLSKLMTDRANITVTINYKVEYGLSNSIFKIDLD